MIKDTQLLAAKKILPPVFAVLFCFVVTLPAAAAEYTVKAGDTLYSIGQKYEVAYTEIQKANGINSILIYPEQKLYIPDKATAVTTSSAKNIATAELDLLARAVYAEARGESFDGQVAVAAVILNRVENNGFPDSIRTVIYEPQQFSCVRDGQINLTPNETAYAAAKAALEGNDPSRSALFFWNPKLVGTHKFLDSLTRTGQIGNHVFAR